MADVAHCPPRRAVLAEVAISQMRMQDAHARQCLPGVASPRASLL
jgi:hypothetical protein